jgi:hypothetical protein
MPIVRRFTRSGRELYFAGAPADLGGVIAGTGNITTTDELNPPFADDMARLTQYRNNFFRHWMTPYWKYSPASSVQQRNCAFTRQGAKWNIRSYYADYFTRLKSMITTAGDNGIAVQLTLFDRCGLDFTKAGEAPVRRWDDSPWNRNNNVNGVVAADPSGGASGLPEFYRNDATLRDIQAAYVRYVVAQTKAWNVFYEIMNEPMGGTPDDRVRWADWVTGVIRAATGGLQLVFYNDHNGGADVNRWKQLGLPNYANFHGVIFHGNPLNINPNNSFYQFRAEKIFQVSTDAGPVPARDTYASNLEWCRHAFANRMMYQAHTIKAEAARGIGDNHPTTVDAFAETEIGGGVGVGTP